MSTSTTNTMSRTITDHKSNALNEGITVTALDEPGSGGANHKYNVIGQAENIPGIGPRAFGAMLRFQNGPIEKIEDMNGITNEALLAVLIDRVRGFQFGRDVNGAFIEHIRGQFACKENACALTHMEEALMWLQKRTFDRVKRGVEGSYAK